MSAWRGTMSSRPVHPFLAAAILLAGCNPLADENRSATILVASISGEGEGGAASGRIYDVVSDSGTVTDEFLDLTLESIPKTTDFQLNPLYRISLQGIEISYSR